MGKRRCGKWINSVLFKAVVMALAAGIALAGAGIVYAAAMTRVLVVPFKVNAEKDLAFLQRGITEMLASRLGQQDKVIVITADQPGDDIAALAKKNHADYVVTGSLTMLGDSVSTDARVIKGAELDNPVLSFGRTGRQQADVIDHIDDLAGRINARILGRKMEQPSQVVAPAPASPTPPPAIDRKADLSQAPSAPAATGIGRPLFSKPQDTATLVPLQLTGIGDFNEQLNGLAAGDVDGDGTVEIAAIGHSRLYVYRMARGRWLKMAQYDGTGKFIGVDMADANNNGRNEIIVTNFDNTEGRPISFAMEWDGHALKRICGQMPWYFRTVNMADRGTLLVGQKQGVGDRFTPGIYEMKLEGGTYVPGERLPLPRKLNIFGFAYGAVRAKGKMEVVTYNSDGYVQLLDSKGHEAFVSTESYGSGANTIVFTDESKYDDRDYIFLPPRIHLHDLDGDGTQEILVMNNETGLGSRVLARHRFFKKGRIEWLNWYGQGIRPTIQSLDMTRYIADTALSDIDADGDLEIVAAIVKKPEGMTSAGSSYLTVFDMKTVQ